MNVLARRLLLGSGILVGLLALAALVSLGIGTVAIPFGDVLGALFSGAASDAGAEAGFIVRELRLPRVLAAGFVGAALAGAGALYQALLRNPLADPFILGISGGAAVGAVLGMTVGLAGSLSLSGAAFLGALGAMALVYGAARGRGHVNTDTLLLVGVIANAFFSAVLLFLLSVARDDGLVRSVYWMMGNLASADYRALLYLSPVLAVLAVFVLRDAKRIHLLQLGAETAWHLGVDVRRTEMRMYVAASLLTAMAVTTAGLVGFVGLVIPHLIRRLFGADFRILFPLSMLGGALLLIVSDTAARTILSPRELPVGVLTAFLGGPFFYWVLRRRAA